MSHEQEGSMTVLLAAEMRRPVLSAAQRILPVERVVSRAVELVEAVAGRPDRRARPGAQDQRAHATCLELAQRRADLAELSALRLSSCAMVRLATPGSSFRTEMSGWGRSSSCMLLVSPMSLARQIGPGRSRP
jgi:hypothetical protein